MSNQLASAPQAETPPAPSQPMQTWENMKKFKPELRSKKNEDCKKLMGKIPTDPMFQMDPIDPAEVIPSYLEDFSEDEDIGP